MILLHFEFYKTVLQIFLRHDKQFHRLPQLLLLLGDLIHRCMQALMNHFRNMRKGGYRDSQVLLPLVTAISINPHNYLNKQIKKSKNK